MQTPIAQVVALIHGNAFLTTKSSLAEFYPANSTFKFCESVVFIDLRQNGNKWESESYAGDPITWLEALRNQGVRSLRMMYGPSAGTQVADRMLVGFVGGGGRWLIECGGRGTSDFWEARWQVGDRNRADRKIWRVTYSRIAKGQRSVPSEAEDLQSLLEEFEHNLRDIGDFARSQRLDNFARLFESARSRLQSNPPYLNQNHSDLAPVGLLPNLACRLLAASQDAWVFGGMGSWNDMGSFDSTTQPRYEELSEKLYRLLNRVTVAAANSSASEKFREKQN